MKEEFNFKINILIVDDDAETRFLNQKEITMLFGYHRQSRLNVMQAGNITEMMTLLKNQPFHLVLLDHCLGTDSDNKHVYGTDYIPQINETQPNTRVLVLTSFGRDSKLAVQAIKNGAMDFLSKGETPEEIEYRETQIKRAIESSQAELEALRRSYINERHHKDHKYKSEGMQELYSDLKTLSEVNTTVLLLGESGLGKNHAAQMLNELSRKFLEQKDRAFVNINVMAFQSNLIEAELFGSERGAYTGSAKLKQGLFEIASEGDIFLDEIGDASLDLQGKLLKVIEEKTFRRVGGEKELSTNARVILATNKDLKQLVKEGKFRSDLYMRIKAFAVTLPQLSQRKEDISTICEDLCEKLTKQHGKKVSYKDFPPALKEFFFQDHIEGNIRGIKNCLERLAIYCKEINGKKRLDYSNWERLLVSSDDKPKQKKQLDFTYDEIIERLSKMITTEKNYDLHKVKRDIESESIIYAYGKLGKDAKVGKALGISSSNAWAKRKNYIEDADMKDEL